MKKLLLNLTFMILLLSVGYSQTNCSDFWSGQPYEPSYGECNESNWQTYYPYMENCNLAGTDLSNADLSNADLSNADLSNTSLSYADLSGGDLSGANFERANLYGANLEGADLRGTYFIEAELVVANLSGAIIGGANFTRANLWGANLTEGEQMGNPTIFEDAFLYAADLSYAYLVGSCFLGANLAWANLHMAWIYGTIMDEACLEGTFGDYEINYYGTPILEGCAIEVPGGNCSHEDIDEDGYDDASFYAGQESGDINHDGNLNITDIIIYVEAILSD